MSAKIAAAATVMWPAVNSAADVTAEHGVVFRIANTTTSTQVGTTTVPIPKNARGRYWRFLTKGADVDFGWLLENGGIGGAAADVTPTLASSQISVIAVGAAAAAPKLIDSIPEHIECPPNAYALVFISSAATGTFEASISGRKTTHSPT